MTIFNSFLLVQNFSAADEAEIEITFDNGATLILKVDVENNYTPNSDATLSYITVGGKTLTFATGTYSCDVTLPYGTKPGSAAATIYAVACDTKATVSIAQVSSLPGSATITVTAENMNTTNVYTINFAFAGKTLIGITTPSAIVGVANGTAKTASALGLPSTVTLVTSGGNVGAGVIWDVASSSYNPSTGIDQSFAVNGTVPPGRRFRQL